MTDSTPRIHVTNDPSFMENGYVVHFRDNGPCWIIDPGLPPQASRILDYLRDHHLAPDAIVLTHAHADHIAGVDPLLEAIGDLPIYLARDEWIMLTDANENLSGPMGMPITVHKAKDIRDLPVGGVIELDETTWQIGDVSGHSPGGRSLYSAEHGLVFVGDALFAGSVGRVDFHHSNGDQLMTNIRETLLALPDDTRVLSGHGSETTIGAERRTNPFILGGL
jgi:glyoxylase-like metal-dependent hydrolase (beta-lactamase superfamily II)